MTASEGLRNMRSTLDIGANAGRRLTKQPAAEEKGSALLRRLTKQQSGSGHASAAEPAAAAAQGSALLRRLTQQRTDAPAASTAVELPKPLLQRSGSQMQRGGPEAEGSSALLRRLTKQQSSTGQDAAQERGAPAAGSALLRRVTGQNQPAAATGSTSAAQQGSALLRRLTQQQAAPEPRLTSDTPAAATRPDRGNAMVAKNDVVGSGPAGHVRPPLPAGLMADVEDNPKGLAAVAAARRFSRQQGSRPASDAGGALAARRTMQLQGEAAAAALAQRRLDRLESQSRVPEVPGRGSADQAASASDTDDEAWARASSRAATSRRATLEPALLAGRSSGGRLALPEVPSRLAARRRTTAAAPGRRALEVVPEQASTNLLEMAGQEAAALGAQAAARQAAAVGQLRAQSDEPGDSVGGFGIDAGVLSESARAAEALGGPTPSDAQQASDPSLSKLQVLAGLIAEPSDWSAAGPDTTPGDHSQQALPADGQMGPAVPPFQHQQPSEPLQPASVAGQQTAATGPSGAARGSGDALQQPAAAQAGTVPNLGHSPLPGATGSSGGAGDALQQPGAAQAETVPSPGRTPPPEAAGQSGAARGAGDSTVPSLGHTPPPDNPAPGVSPAAFQNPVIGAGAGTGTAVVEGAGAGGSTEAAQQLHSQLQLAGALGASKGAAQAGRRGSGSCVESQAATLEVVAAILSSTAAHLRADMRAQEGRVHQQWEQAAAQCSQLQGQVAALQHTLLSPEGSTQHLHRPLQSLHHSPADVSPQIESQGRSEQDGGRRRANRRSPCERAAWHGEWLVNLGEQLGRLQARVAHAGSRSAVKALEGDTRELRAQLLARTADAGTARKQHDLLSRQLEQLQHSLAQAADAAETQGRSSSRVYSPVTPYNRGLHAAAHPNKVRDWSIPMVTQAFDKQQQSPQHAWH